MNGQKMTKTWPKNEPSIPKSAEKIIIGQKSQISVSKMNYLIFVL